jgi:hypothetical protein
MGYWSCLFANREAETLLNKGETKMSSLQEALVEAVEQIARHQRRLRKEKQAVEPSRDEAVQTLCEALDQRIDERIDLDRRTAR